MKAIPPVPVPVLVLVLVLAACGNHPGDPDGATDAGPVRVLDRHVVVGEGVSCAYRVGGGLTCWGDNTQGQLGAPELVDHLPPTRGPLAAANVVAVGLYRTCAIDPSAATWCWGSTAYGVLGDGSPGIPGTPHPAPARVATDLPFTALRAGSLHTCGLLAVGSARCWGNNFTGQLGDGTTDYGLAPVIPSAYRGDFIADVALFHGTLFVDRDGHTEAFGERNFGVETITGLADAVSYVYTGYTACALRTAGEVWCAGRSDYGAVGIPPTGELCAGFGIEVDCVTHPVKLDLPPIATLLGGGADVCALTATGAAYCWGSNEHGSLGTGTDEWIYTPVEVRLPGARAIAELAVGTQMCALADDNTVWCWGKNDHGQVGDGTVDDRLSPVHVPIDWD